MIRRHTLAKQGFNDCTEFMSKSWSGLNSHCWTWFPNFVVPFMGFLYILYFYTYFGLGYDKVTSWIPSWLWRSGVLAYASLLTLTLTAVLLSRGFQNLWFPLQASHMVLYVLISGLVYEGGGWHVTKHPEQLHTCSKAK